MRGTCVQSFGFIESHLEADLVQARVQVLQADAAFVVAVPLAENAVEIAARGIPAAEHSSHIFDVFYVDGGSDSLAPLHIEVLRCFL